jgi:cytosine/adenosine deaminase-related metal-dependent hydrolase
MFRRSRTVSFINGRVTTQQGTASSVRFAERVMALDEPPRDGDHVVDLDGAFVLPGLINAHDHLELNHYGRLKCRDRYENATAWIDDLRPALAGDAHIRRNSAYKLRDRLFVGGLKNLIAGVTTVAHHNPMYRELKTGFPVRVVTAFGWAHSFALEGRPVGAGGEPGPDVSQERRATPSSLPFIVHAAEGVDTAAGDEITRLDTLGCLRPGTVLVHGVALTEGEWRRLLELGVSLVWCPASNAFLFGTTIPARTFLDASPDAWSHLCLGSDSRVTGSRDLLEEMRAALAADSVTAFEILRMVTVAPARILKLPEAGEIAVGHPADLLVVPGAHDTAAETLANAARSDLWCVAISGRPMIADRRFCGMFAARGVEARPITIDDTEHVAEAALARAIARCPIQEPGVASVA